MNQTDRFFQIIPPTASGEHKVISEAVDTTAEEWDWVTDLGADAPKGTVFVNLEAVDADCYVYFHSATGAAAVTSATGLLIKADQPGRPFWVDPTIHRYIYVVATAAGTLKLQVASKIGARKDI